MLKIIALLLCSLNLYAQSMLSFKNLSYDKINGRFEGKLALDVFRPMTGDNLPVVVFVHGGGWTEGDKSTASHIAKRDYFINHGFIFVSINYRLAPANFFPVYAQDVAQAYSYVMNWIGKFGGDNQKVFLMGHSAGAHLAALIAADNRYLNQFGYDNSYINGVILLDGAGYDIPELIADNTENNNQTGLDMYHQAFGYEIGTWIEASPITYMVEGHTVPPYQLFYVNSRRLGNIMSNRMYDAMHAKGLPAEIIPVYNTTHDQINKNFGKDNDLVAPQALAFIEDILEQQLQLKYKHTNLHNDF